MRELALHILDIARNSIEAGASSVEIDLVEDRQADKLEITIRDDGPGMSSDVAAKAADPFYSTRTTRRVGLGLALFKAACERSDGDFAISSEPGEGATVRGAMRLSHFDRPPLGDMAAVVQALACEADSISLRYRHQSDGRVFEVDTAELQRELGEVRLTDPRVLCWLAEHVKNGIVDIGSKA